MTNPYRLMIHASYPETKNQIFTQCDLSDCFTDVDKFGVESEHVNGREYIYYTGQAEGALFIDKMAQDVLKSAQETLIQQLKDMSDEPQTEEQLAQLKIKVFLIDLEDWTEYGVKQV